MKITFLLLAGLLSTGWANAAALVETVSGDVQVERNGVTSGIQANQRIEEGSTVHTSGSGRAVLRFDDGQLAALNPNTDFRIDGYRFDAAKPELDRIAMSIFRGSMRFVTGLIGGRNRSAFALKTTTATVGIRGTDFAVGVQGGDYLSVTQGAVSGTTSAGTTNFVAGQFGFVSSSSALATVIPSTAIPPGISTAFTQLGALPLGGAVGGGTGAAGTSGTGAAGGGAAAGAQAASATALGGVSVGSIAAGAAVLGIFAVSGGSTGTSGTTGTK
jgi:FecR protein